MIECLKCGSFCEDEEMYWSGGIDEEENEIVGDWEVVCGGCFYKLEKKYYKTHKMWDKLNELEGTTKENKE